LRKADQNRPDHWLPSSDLGTLRGADGAGCADGIRASLGAARAARVMPNG
jgi:hypothetical protein